MVYARIQSEENQNHSIHWTQEYAALNRVVEHSLDEKQPIKSFSEFQLSDILPGKAVQERLKLRWAVLASRVVCKYLTKFKQLQDVIVSHIPHPYATEMATKSNIVSVN